MGILARHSTYRDVIENNWTVHRNDYSAPNTFITEGVVGWLHGTIGSIRKFTFCGYFKSNCLHIPIDTDAIEICNDCLLKALKSMIQCDDIIRITRRAIEALHGKSNRGAV